jgi:hypothetical protein
VACDTPSAGKIIAADRNVSLARHPGSPYDKVFTPISQSLQAVMNKALTDKYQPIGPDGSN